METDTAELQNTDENPESDQPTLVQLLQQQLYQQQMQHRQQLQLHAQQQQQLLLEALLNRPTTSTEATVKANFGVYDGTTDYLIYRAQFENAASRANWSYSDKCFHLSQQLRGKAAKVYGTLLRLGTVITHLALNEALDKHREDNIHSST